MYKIDLHTHSTASPDGGISPEQYRQILATERLHYIAITDHDRIDLALRLHQELGDQIIVGEEITTQQGEVIGLYLSERVAPGLSAADTIKAIKAQNGLVYIPHPFETVRKGLTQTTLDAIAQDVDIIEVHNGRAVFQNRGPAAATWAKLHHTIGAASSDAHGLKGVGHTHTTVSEAPTRANLLTLLTQGRLTVQTPPWQTLLYPKLNRARKRLQRRSR